MLDYKGRLARTKRKCIPLKEVQRFKTPEHFSIFNHGVKYIERLRRKPFSAREYRILVVKFSKDIDFNNCYELYYNDKEFYTKPSLTKINPNKKHTVDNLKVSKLKSREFYLFEKTIESEMRSIDANMNNSVGYDFLINFDDPDRIRFLLLSIKKSGKCKRAFNFSKEEKRDFILKFYNDPKFVKLYKLYINSSNRYIRPSLDHKIPISKGGANELDNLHFISFLENISKNDMTWKDWKKIKKVLHKFMDF